MLQTWIVRAGTRDMEPSRNRLNFLLMSNATIWLEVLKVSYKFSNSFYPSQIGIFRQDTRLYMYAHCRFWPGRVECRMWKGNVPSWLKRASQQELTNQDKANRTVWGSGNFRYLQKEVAAKMVRKRRTHLKLKPVFGSQVQVKRDTSKNEVRSICNLALDYRKE